MWQFDAHDDLGVLFDGTDGSQIDMFGEARCFQSLAWGFLKKACAHSREQEENYKRERKCDNRNPIRHPKKLSGDTGGRRHRPQALFRRWGGRRRSGCLFRQVVEQHTPDRTQEVRKEYREVPGVGRQCGGG